MTLQAKRGKGSDYESEPLDPSEKPGTFVGGSDLVEQGDLDCGYWKSTSITTVEPSKYIVQMSNGSEKVRRMEDSRN
jgi:hypothetical protein